MKKVVTLLLFLFTLAVYAQPPKSILSYVNPFSGTGGHGHTYPGATVPYGMVQLSPDTRLDGWDGCSGYHYDDSSIYGFSHTHLSGTGVSDYGDLLLMPATALPVGGQLYAYRSTFRHEKEHASPGYYRVDFENGVSAELTAALFSGYHRYTYPTTDSQWVVLRFDHRDKTTASAFRRINASTVAGYRHSSAWAQDQRLFFVLEFNTPVRLYNAKGELLPDTASYWQQLSEVWIRTAKSQLVGAKLSLSGVDEQGAWLNHQQRNADFEEARAQAQQDWTKELSAIRIKGDELHLRKFYTALYHTMLQPNRFSDADGWYRGLDGKLHESRQHTQYTVFSLWDTYRAAHPLYSLIDEQRTRDYLATFLAHYKQAGHLPVWELAGNETWCMIGYHSASVIADAVWKGLADTATAKELLQAMMATSNDGRYGRNVYNRKGYLEIEDESESVSKTLEYAYNDWCIGRVASWLGNTELARKYYQRSSAWINVLDPAIGLMRPRTNGGFLKPFDPREVNNHFTEANSWQYSFYVPHDLEGYMGVLGGEKRLENLLDSLFSAPSKTTGRDQADITGLIGQYAHGNEPSHHIAFLYHAVGKPAKTQRLVNAILDTLYRDAPDGLSGNEDCGQMSAWYVMASLGLYQVAPGEPNYVLLAPAQDYAAIRTGSDRDFEVLRRGNGAFIERVLLNGRSWPFAWLPHDSIRQGGKLEVQMSNALTSWGTAKEHRWVSAGMSMLLPSPVLNYSDAGFYDSLVVSWKAQPGARIRYTLDGSDPRFAQDAKANKLVLKESSRLRIVQYLAIGANDRVPAFVSNESYASFYRIPEKRSLSWSVAPKKEYRASGEKTLIDGLTGDREWRKGRWVGWQGTDVELKVDLSKVRKVEEVYGSFVQDSRSWILFPTRFDVEGSRDGKIWVPLLLLEPAVNPFDDMPQTTLIGERLQSPVELRYLRVRIKHYGALPHGHIGAPGAAYIFMDELIVR